MPITFGLPSLQILVGLPFALARLMEASSRWLTAKGTGPRN